jgi:hypothetical protein
MVSKKFRDVVRLHPKKQYELAWKAGINPSTLSQIMTGYIRPRHGDERVISVGKLVGLNPDECFVKGGTR